MEQGIPGITGGELFSTQRDLLVKIEHGVGENQERWRRYYLPIIRRYALWVHLLPASREHHHYGAGGLLRHGLEAALAAAGLFDRRVVGGEIATNERKKYQQGMRWAAVCGALLHDCAKPLTDVEVIGDVSGDLWNPVKGSLVSWLGATKERNYQLRWRKDREGMHRVGAAIMVPRIIGADAMAWLYQASGRSALIDLIDAVMDDTRTGMLAEIISEADRLSVSEDLARRADINEDHHIVGISAEKHILSAARALLREGQWKLDGKVCIRAPEDEVLLAWPRAMKDIGDWFALHNVPGIMRSPEAIAAVLIDTGSAVPGPHDATTWRMRVNEGAVIAGLRLRAGLLDVAGAQVGGKWEEGTETSVAPGPVNRDPGSSADNKDNENQRPVVTEHMASAHEIVEDGAFRDKVLACEVAAAIFGDLANGNKAMECLFVGSDKRRYLMYPDAFAGYGMTPLQAAKEVIAAGVAQGEGKRIAFDVDDKKGSLLCGFEPVFDYEHTKQCLSGWFKKQTEGVIETKGVRYLPFTAIFRWLALFGANPDQMLTRLREDGLISVGKIPGDKGELVDYARIGTPLPEKTS